MIKRLFGGPSLACRGVDNSKGDLGIHRGERGFIHAPTNVEVRQSTATSRDG